MFCEKFISPMRINVKTGLQIFPKISDRKFWEENLKYSLEFFEENVKQYNPAERKPLSAALYRRIAFDGDRVAFENVYFARRAELANKIILECYYNDGRYMEDILDLIWMIMEEITWIIPAHIFRDPGSDSLPVMDEKFIDLFSAETACTLSFAIQTMGEKLNEMSVNILPRIKARLCKMVELYTERDDMYWMAFREGSRAANWNPWITSNMLVTAFTVVEDKEILQKFVYKALRVLDRYYEVYPLDGACDEGPVYWTQAGLSMMEDLWLLKIGTDGQIDVFNEEKVKNTLEFFMKVYTGRGQVMNFADSSLNVPVYYATIYKVAKFAKNEKVISFAKSLYDTENANSKAMADSFLRGRNISSAMTKVMRMMDIVAYSAEMENLPDSGFKPDSDYYLASTQVMTSRFESDPEKGLFLGAKGGHNGEHHNHNDVGSFVVYKNGTKFLIDSGNMQYRKETFTEERYNLVSTRSGYHNVPLIDGVEQQAGKEFAAKNADYKNDGKKVSFSLDIADAYPDKVAKKWVRSLEYDKSAQTILVSEDFALAKTSEFSLNFLTPQKTERNGNVIKFAASNGETFEMSFDTDFEFETEKLVYDDRLFIANWGEDLYRISLKFKGKDGKITYIIK
ncbi:MAG: heparinase II/III family protein [Clostridia bacterium]|nr:heparinase II/III family protein [Clostridia bacterium]